MNLFDSVKVPVGIFQLSSYDARSGRLLERIEGENIVVNDGREALARLLGNDGGPTTWYVDTIKFGDGGHNPLDVTEMLPVDITDSDLYGTEHFSTAVTVTFPALKKVTFTGTVEAAEGNSPGDTIDPNEYSEAGLYYNGGLLMFAHKSFGYVVKNSTIRLVATWTFTF